MLLAETITFGGYPVVSTASACRLEALRAARSPVTHGVEFDDKVSFSRNVVAGDLCHKPCWAVEANPRNPVGPGEVGEQAFPNIPPTNVNPTVGVENSVDSVLIGC